MEYDKDHDADFAVGVTYGEHLEHPLEPFVGQSVEAGGEHASGPVERVAFAADVSNTWLIRRGDMRYRLGLISPVRSAWVSQQEHHATSAGTACGGEWIPTPQVNQRSADPAPQSGSDPDRQHELRTPDTTANLDESPLQVTPHRCGPPGGPQPSRQYRRALSQHLYREHWTRAPPSADVKYLLNSEDLNRAGVPLSTRNRYRTHPHPIAESQIDNVRNAQIQPIKSDKENQQISVTGNA